LRLPVKLHAPVVGSYNSALLRTPPTPTPPATSSLPSDRSVAVWLERPVPRPPVNVQLAARDDCANADGSRRAATLIKLTSVRITPTGDLKCFVRFFICHLLFMATGPFPASTAHAGTRRETSNGFGDFFRPEKL
jgi:hypothetical protein